jgi:hypothetical protein
VVLDDGRSAAVFADDQGITLFRDDTFTVLSPGARGGARAVALPDRSVLVAGGPTPDLAVVDPTTGALTTLADAGPSCAAPAVAATSRHVLVSCAGATLVLDASSLQASTRFETAYAAMAPLPNDQVLLVGAGLFLFTPGPPEG